MGNILSPIFNRLLDYPLKVTRPCAYEPEVPQQENAGCKTPSESNYDKVTNEFEKKLLEKRMKILSLIDGKTWEERKLLINFPEWNDSTISYLHSIFLTFCSEDNKMIDFKGFSCILACLFCETESSKRSERFNLTDSNQDGFVDYTEFLELIYNYGNFGVQAKSVSEKTRFISELSIGQQLEYGLF